MKQEVKSKSKGKAKHTEMSDVWLLEEDEGGQEIVTTDEQRVLRGDWTMIQQVFFGFWKKRKSNNM